MNRRALAFALVDAVLLWSPFVAVGFLASVVRFDGSLSVAIGALLGAPVLLLVGIRSYVHCVHETTAFWGVRRVTRASTWLKALFWT